MHIRDTEKDLEMTVKKSPVKMRRIESKLIYPALMLIMNFLGLLLFLHNKMEKNINQPDWFTNIILIAPYILWIIALLLLFLIVRKKMVNDPPFSVVFNQNCGQQPQNTNTHKG